MKNDLTFIILELLRKLKEVIEIGEKYFEEQNNIKDSIKSSSNQDDQIKTDRIIPLSQWNDYHKWPTVNALRNMYFTCETNGADYFVKKVGRRVLIDEKLFFEWVRKTPEERIKLSPKAKAYHEKYKKKW